MFKYVKNLLYGALVKSQALTGTDNVYIARGSFWTGSGQALGTILSLAQILAFAHFLPPQEYGTYKYLLSIAGMLGFLTLTGMNTAVTQMTARGIEGALPASVKVQLRWNSLYLIASIFAAIYYLARGNYILAGGLGILGVTFPLSAAFNTYGAYLSGRKDFRRAAIYGAVSSCISTVLLIGSIAITKNVIVIVTAYALGSVLPGYYFYRTILSSTRHPKLAPQERQELTQYSGHLSFMNVLATIDQYIDKVFLFQSSGAVELAVYTLAQAVPERIKSYSKSFTSLLLPKIANKEVADIRPVFYIRLFQGALLGACAFILYWFTAPLLFNHVLPQYVQSIPYSRVFMITALFTLPNSYIASIFRAKKMVRALYISSTAGHSIKILLYLILGSMMGIWGLIWAALITQIVGTTINCALWEYESRRA